MTCLIFIHSYYCYSASFDAFPSMRVRLCRSPQEKVDLLRSESETMRRRERDVLAAHAADADAKIQRALHSYQQLPAEIESLKAVLEMRNQEIHELRRKNNDYEKQVRDLSCVVLRHRT